MKSTFSGQQFCPRKCGADIIHLASKICEITRNSEKIQTYTVDKGHPRSSILVLIENTPCPEKNGPPKENVVKCTVYNTIQ